MICHCCQEIREQEGMAPRELIALPAEYFPGLKRNEPLLLCKWCDGDALIEIAQSNKG